MRPEISLKYRCFDNSRSTDNSLRCGEEYIYDPDNSEIVRSGRKLTRVGNSSTSVYDRYIERRGSRRQITQIYPQIVSLKLRINEKYDLKLHYSQAQPNHHNFSTVEMKDTSSNAVQVVYYSSCLANGELIQTSKCGGLQVGDIVSFTAEIIVLSCPKDPFDWQTTLQIYADGINESLTVDLTMLCDCPCEKSGFETNSPICNGQGTFKCGICECAKNTIGDFCECSVTDTDNQNEMSMACRPDNRTIEDCSSRGQCVCGVCECKRRIDLNEIFYGKYCECDNFSCERYNDQLCSGPENGICQCGVCQCLPGWLGASCQCTSSIETCMNQDGEICSGHGTCVCGECICDATDDGSWSGRFCEKYPELN